MISPIRSKTFEAMLNRLCFVPGSWALSTVFGMLSMKQSVFVFHQIPRAFLRLTLIEINGVWLTSIPLVVYVTKNLLRITGPLCDIKSTTFVYLIQRLLLVHCSFSVFSTSKTIMHRNIWRDFFWYLSEFFLTLWTVAMAKNGLPLQSVDFQRLIALKVSPHVA